MERRKTASRKVGLRAVREETKGIGAVRLMLRKTAQRGRVGIGWEIESTNEEKEDGKRVGGLARSYTKRYKGSGRFDQR